MWALAIWDHHKKHLFLSRDRFGKKPLFYAFLKDKQGRDMFVFASEMKAIYPYLEQITPSKYFNTMSNIASEVGISLGALSTAVNALVRKGYISRGGDASDRRKVYIYLTETGEKAFLLHKEFHKKMISGITKLLNENECETLIKALSTITCFFNNSDI